jgi:hypothetical protein
VNKSDKSAVAALISKLENLKSEIESVGSELSSLAEAEQEKYDNAAENLQGSEQYLQIEAAAEALAEAADARENGSVGEALEALGNIEL